MTEVMTTLPTYWCGRKSPVQSPRCWVESITPRFATGHQHLKRGETGATLIAQIGDPLATDYGQWKRTLAQLSSRFTCERADTQGSKYDQGSQDAKSVVEVLKALIRTRRIERYLKRIGQFSPSKVELIKRSTKLLSHVQVCWARATPFLCRPALPPLPQLTRFSQP